MCTQIGKSPAIVFSKNQLYGLIDIHRYYFLFIDIDNFREINDNHGHRAGDEVIKAYGVRLAEVVRNVGTVYKFNGDEFLLTVEKNKQRNIHPFVKRLQRKMEELFFIHGFEIILTSTVGIYAPKKRETIDDAIRKSYIGHHYAKSKHLEFSVYTNEIEDCIKRKCQIGKELKKSVINHAFDEFSVVYQPIYFLGESKIGEAEALLRWNNPELGKVSPSEFILPAEETGLIKELGKWLIKRVLKQIKQWQKKGIDLRVTVNLSPVQIEEKGFLTCVKKMIEQEAVDYDRMKFEITETQILRLQEENRKILEELLELGVDIAIDDFGEGYSSMKNIVFLPINEIKIDKKFIDLIHMDEKIQILISSLIHFAHKAGYKVTAEGVESEEQFEKLRELRCDKIQGYYISKPVSEEEMEEILVQGTIPEKEKGKE